MTRILFVCMGNICRSPTAKGVFDRALTEAGIACRRGIMAAHHEPAASQWLRTPLPTTDLLSSSTLILPLHHEMTASQVDRVVDHVLAAVG